MRYAQNTDVPVDRTKTEIEKLLVRYGASRFVVASNYENGTASVMFEMKNRQLKFDLPLPPRNAKEFTTTPTGRQRKNAGASEIAWEQACRSRWRALLLAIKAKLEAVAIGIAVFDNEFLAYIVVNDRNRSTVGQLMSPQLDEACKSGRAPMLLDFKGG